MLAAWCGRETRWGGFVNLKFVFCTKRQSIVFLICLGIVPVVLTKPSLAQTTFTATSGAFTTTATHSASGFDVKSTDGIDERFTNIGSAGIAIVTESVSRPGVGTGADLQSSGLSLSAGPAGSAFTRTFSVDSETGNLESSGSGIFESLGISGASSFGTGVNATTIDSTGAVSIASSLTIANGATVNMGGNRVQGVGNPTQPTDAANQDYVDTKVRGQQTQITGLQVENAQQSAAISDLFVRDAAQQRQIEGLQERDEELSEGIAIALSLDTPTFLPGQDFALRAGWGNFDGSDAFGVTAGGVIDRGSFGRNSSVILDGGVGFGLNTNTVAGKAGLSFGW